MKCETTNGQKVPNKTIENPTEQKSFFVEMHGLLLLTPGEIYEAPVQLILIFHTSNYFHHQVNAKQPTARRHKCQDKGTSEPDDIPPPVPLPPCGSCRTRRLSFCCSSHTRRELQRTVKQDSDSTVLDTWRVWLPALALSFVSQSVKPGPRVGTDLALSSLVPLGLSSAHLSSKAIRPSATQLPSLCLYL